MKVLHRLPTTSALTVDTTMLTVDTTEITVDATILEDSSIATTLTLLPRKPITTTEDLSIYLRNELSNEEWMLPVSSITKNGNYTVLTFDSIDLDDNYVYELMVLYGEDLESKEDNLYKGKAYVSTKEKEDMQDFKVVEKTNNGKLKL
jgi:hypothetical protein